MVMLVLMVLAGCFDFDVPTACSENAARCTSDAAMDGDDAAADSISEEGTDSSVDDGATDSASEDSAADTAGDAPDSATDVGDAAVCTAGEKTCSGKTARACNADRTGWIDETCAIGCAAGSCLKVVDLSANAGKFTCAVISDGTVRCWGADSAAATGDAPFPHNRPVAISGITGAAQIATSTIGAIVRLTDGTAKWWGTIPEMDPSTTTRVPKAIAGVTGAIEVALGTTWGCARLGAGGVLCFGREPARADGTTNHAFTPTTVSSIASAMSLALGNGFGFAIVPASIIGTSGRGWGENTVGQLGDSSTTFASSVRTVYGKATQISAGNAHSCARLSTGAVYCAGFNLSGQLGDGTTTDSSTIVAASGITNATQVCAGVDHSCARLDDGSLRCWGSGYNGMLGTGATSRSLTPVAVLGISNASKVVCGSAHTCALLVDGTVKCWGDNVFGQVGAGSTDTMYLSPTAPAW